jgi:hypothetical protein
LFKNIKQQAIQALQKNVFDREEKDINAIA